MYGRPRGEEIREVCRTGVEEEEKERPFSLSLHVLELVYAALRVALADLAQSLVLVTPLSDILLVQDVVAGQLGVVLHGRQLLAQHLKLVP